MSPTAPHLIARSPLPGTTTPHAPPNLSPPGNIYHHCLQRILPTMEALGFASDSSLGSLPLQAWAESCPHCRRGLFSVFWATPGCGWASADVLHVCCWVRTRAASIIGTRGAHPRMQEAAPVPRRKTHMGHRCPAWGPGCWVSTSPPPAQSIEDWPVFPISDWELPQVQTPSLNKFLSAPLFTSLDKKVPTVHLRCHLAKGIGATTSLIAFLVK